MAAAPSLMPEALAAVTRWVPLSAASWAPVTSKVCTTWGLGDSGPTGKAPLSLAMLSAVTGRKVLPRVAMTGEVTLRGHVLMIGGLKEKLLAARMAQVKKVLVPAKNQPDVEELSKEITKGMEIVYIKEMNEVIREAFVPEK